ncbi:helix-turn-helix domain-containing protein [Sandaracinus amylolyticus]|uniref:Response regulator of zinc sigma-54-dependent two-component system n=1 Tax=Sandaracinus amylolyticus TaxID=927083 RepID=A0A0F6YIF4_9BACT|nr:helix-turn-helix domain-containing protein [Sandaracinus amylolyticus]AKF05870.1 Response regulator of zinc sigma-54-dependent two-component system [Sandaracinus amylolyticus]
MARRPAAAPSRSRSRGASPSAARRSADVTEAVREAAKLAPVLREAVLAGRDAPTPKLAARADALFTKLLERGARAVAKQPALASECALAALSIARGEEARTRAYDVAAASANALGGARAAEIWLHVAIDAWAHGRIARAQSAADRASACAGDGASPELRARIALERGRIAFGRSEWAVARAHTEDARAIAASNELVALEALAHVGLAAIGSHELAPDAARHARRAILLAERIGSKDVLGRAQAQLGIVLVERGVHDEGRRVLESAITLERERGEGENECRALLYLSMLEVDAGRPLHALHCLGRAREVAMARGSRVARAMVHGSVGVVHLVRGHPRPAARELVEADLVLEDVGNRHARITFSAFLAAAEALAGRPTEARAAFAQARTLMQEGVGPAYGVELLRVLEQVLAVTEGASVDDARDVLAEIERGSVAAHWADLRVACALARRAIVGEAASKLPRIEPTPGLVIAHDGRWFSLEGSRPIDLESRPVLRRTLAVLAEARVSEPGVTVARATLVERLWPEDARLGERLLENRMNVAIATLRRLGLRDAIRTGDRGYRLREDLPVTIDPG